MILPILLIRTFSVFSECLLLYLIPVIIYNSTQSATVSALVYALERISRIISLPVMGDLGSKYNSKKLLLLTEIFRSSICFSLLMSMLLFDGVNIYVMIMSGILLAYFSGSGYVNFEPLTASYFSASRLHKVNAILQSIEQGCNTIAPLIGAYFLINYSPSSVVVVALIPFCISASILLMINTKGVNENVTKKSISIHIPLSDVLIYLKDNIKLRQIIALTFLNNILVGCVLSSVLIVISESFHKGMSEFAKFQSISSVVNILVLIALPFVAKKIPLENIGLHSIVILSISTLLASVVGNYHVFFVCIILMMACDSIFNVYARTSRKSLLPELGYSSYLGVILVINQAAIPLSSFFISVLSKIISTQHCYFFIAALGLASYLYINKYTYKYNVSIGNGND